MNYLHNVNNANEIDPADLNKENFEILGIGYSAQLLVDKNVNEYRQAKSDELVGDERNKLYINRYVERTLNTPCGPCTYFSPLFREKGFNNEITPPWCRDTEDFDLSVYINFIAGMSTRDIERATSLMGIECSRSKVSRIAKKYQGRIDYLQNRNLSDKKYCYLSVDATYASILTNDPENNHYEKKPVFRAVALNSETGYWETLAIKAYESENTESYTDFLYSLRERGLKNPVIFIQDFDSALAAAMKIVFPLSFKQGCLFHFLQLIYRNLPDEVEHRLFDSIVKLVNEKDAAVRQKDLKDLVETYEKKCPKVIDSLQKNLEDAMAWNSFNPEFKTNNMNERANEEDKRLIKSKGAFKSVESAENIMMANSEWYMSNVETKKQADLGQIVEMLERYKRIFQLVSEDVLDCFQEALIPEAPPKFSAPIVWFDTVEVPCEKFGLETTIKVLVCYTLKKVGRKRCFLWACPLLQADQDTYVAALETIKESELKKTRFVVLPAQDTLLINAVKQVFKESEIQVDLKDFENVVTDLLPSDYKDAFRESFAGAFKNDGLAGFTEDTIELIEKSLSHHHLKEALNKFSRLKQYLLTLFKHDINYFFNIQPVKNLRNRSYPKRNPDENSRSFLVRVLKGFRLTTYGIPCVYMDEISTIFDEFNST